MVTGTNYNTSLLLHCCSCFVFVSDAVIYEKADQELIELEIYEQHMRFLKEVEEQGYVNWRSRNLVDATIEIQRVCFCVIRWS